MAKPGPVFEIEKTPEYTCWAEIDQGAVTIHKTSNTPLEGDEVLARWSPNVLRNLLLWADQGRSVTVSLTGPMAQQVKEHAKELMLTPEMFVWHAVKVFIEVGESP